MTDWSSLQPHEPLRPGDERYVPGRDAGGTRIAQWILAGGQTVLVAGPVGIGKSTELASACHQVGLHGQRHAVLAQLDRVENVRRITADRMLLRLAGALADQVGAKLAGGLNEWFWFRLRAEGVVSGGPPVSGVSGVSPIQGASPAALLAMVLAEVKARGGDRRVCFLVDGLEKMEEEAARDVLDHLALLPAECDLVVVIPWHVAFGHHGGDILRSGERLIVLRAPRMDGDAALPERQRFAELLQRRVRPTWNTGDPGAQFLLGLLAALAAGQPAQPDPTQGIVQSAAILSGGVPRTFLQLLADAATYARVRRGALMPDGADLDSAVGDHLESLRLLLQPGDKDVLRAARNTDGSEIDLARRIRFLSHGLLLERANGQVVLEPHPLVERLL